MTAKEATREIRLNEWKKIFNDRATTDLTIDKYCELNNLSRNSYYYWLRLAKEQAIENSGVEFTEITLPAVTENTQVQISEPDVTVTTSYLSSSSVTMQVNGITITVTDNVSTPLLKKVLEVAIDVK